MKTDLLTILRPGFPSHSQKPSRHIDPKDQSFKDMLICVCKSTHAVTCIFSYMRRTCLRSIDMLIYGWWAMCFYLDWNIAYFPSWTHITMYRSCFKDAPSIGPEREFSGRRRGSRSLMTRGNWAEQQHASTALPLDYVMQAAVLSYCHWLLQRKTVTWNCEL